jgi:hypothetical protein
MSDTITKGYHREVVVVVDIEVLSLEWSHAEAETVGLEFSLFIAGDIEPSFLSSSAELVGALPQPLTRMCLCFDVS